MYSTRYDHATAAAEHGCPQGATRPRRGHAGDPDRRVPGGPVGPDGCLRPQGGRDRGVPAGGRRLPAPPPLPARLGTAPRASLCHGRLAGGRVLPDARPWSARHRAGADRVRPGALRRPADPGPPAVAPSDDRAPLVRRPAGGGPRQPFPDFPVVGAPRVGLRPGAFHTYAIAVLLTSYVGLVGYFLVPTAPPWLAALQGALPPVSRVLHMVEILHVPRFLVLGLD